MEVNLTPTTESRLLELASQSGKPASELIEDAMAGYLAEVEEVRFTVDSRYDEIKNGLVKPVDGATFFRSLRERQQELLNNRRLK